jgi:two-component system CheB/CheR fusion protein
MNIAARRRSAPTVYLIDEDNAVRETMRALLEREGQRVVAFASCEAFLGTYRPNGGGCLVVDTRLSRLSAIELLQRLKAERRELPAIVITDQGDIAMAVEAMKADAIDFIEKPIRIAELLASIDRALALVENSMAFSDRLAAMGLIARLTPRERQIMDMVIAGYANKVIAAEMKVSQRTVESHRAAVMRKTRSKSLSDLVRLAIAAA